MFEVLIPVALIATFASVVLGGIAIEGAISERRKTVEVIQAQVGRVAANLRNEELSQSFVDRVIGPLVGKTSAITKRITPLGLRKRIERKLVLAGMPANWDVEKVAAFKIAGLIAGVMFALVVVGLEAGSRGTLAALGALFGAVGYFAPDALLSGKARVRQDSIQKALPDTMDLLTISVEAGLGFDAALAQVIRNVPGPLSQEIGRLLHELQLGSSRDDAFRMLAERTDVDELKAFVLSMIQANRFGVGIANVLRAQARELRTKRRQRAERKAMQTPVKILFPLIFCVLPALFVVVMGPGAIRIFQSFFGS